MSFFHLVYLSSARQGWGKSQLRALLEHARGKNFSLGVTGLLLHQEGRFLQVLEGEERVVRRLFDTIQADPRHHGCVSLLEENIAARQYPQWPMAFREMGMSDLPAFAGLPTDLSEAQEALLHLHFSGSGRREAKLLAA
jgi:hypothetical protein